MIDLIIVVIQVKSQPERKSPEVDIQRKPAAQDTKNKVDSRSDTHGAKNRCSSKK
jgi:hypothetical protein